MTDEITKNELQALRDRVADLEASRDKPVKVEIEGLEGIQQLSHAIETQQLDRFGLQNASPDRVFWGWFWAFVAFASVVFILMIVRYFSDGPILGF